jgi:hypothetical protein
MQVLRRIILKCVIGCEQQNLIELGRIQCSVERFCVDGAD